VLGASVNYSPEFSAPEPNLNLLRRIAETSGGEMLNPLNPSDNPFLHERQKTFQPRDLWEWLLKLAVILFPFDVGVRRIQLDRDEWLRATKTLRRWLFFWKGVPRTPEADKSLACLADAPRTSARETNRTVRSTERRIIPTADAGHFAGETGASRAAGSGTATCD
jgi:hypothetical protein